MPVFSSAADLEATSNVVKHGRVDAALLNSLIEPAKKSATTAYVCGPPAFTDSVVRALESDVGLPLAAIRIESFGSSGDVSCTK